jgi:hypothetical protein
MQRKMRYILLLILLASFAAQAQKKNIPRGFEWVKKRNLVVAANEISCRDWLEFYSRDQDPSMLPQPNKIVSTCIYEKNEDGEVTIRDTEALFRDTSFVELEKGKTKKRRGIEQCSTMPVTGIWYEQALAYCDWLTEKYADDPKYAGLKLTFRLPKPPEMDSLLMDMFSAWKEGDENYLAFQKGINKHGCALYNHLHNSWCDVNLLMKKEFGYGVPIRAAVFFPDMNGLMDLMGNVAEMTSEKGIAKGGSCVSSAAECQPGAVNRYDSPQMWLGFRVVADLK